MTTVTTERLRAQHRAAVLQIKSTMKPYDPRRLELLASCDELARKIRAIERANEK
jgi:hypothetical protein